MLVDRKFYRAKDLYSAYGTEQVYLDREHPDACGIHTVLSPWHIKGRLLPWIPNLLQRRYYAIIGYDWTKDPRQTVNKPRKLKPKHPLAVVLAKLPPDQAIKHWRRLDSLGAFSCA